MKPAEPDPSLEAELNDLRGRSLGRSLRTLDSAQGRSVTVNGRELLNFSSNDYLGLANHPAVKQAAVDAIGRFGAGSGASRLISGSLRPHGELEEALAALKHAPAALAFTTGYAAAAGTLQVLLGREDVVLLDRKVHACCIDAARASPATLRVFAHNDLDDLERKLRWAARYTSSPGRAGRRRPRILIVTESVFSMDGDLAPLRNLIELKERHGAWLMVDEAHATGLYGVQRGGLCEEFGIAHQVEIQMGTLGKALGSAGGFIAGSRSLVDLLINRARSFIFSTAPPPAQAAAALAAIRILGSAEGESLAHGLWGVVDLAKSELTRCGWPPGPVRSPIIPLIVGDEAAAVNLSGRLFEEGLLLPAVRYPSVARGEARLRLTLSAVHRGEDLERLAKAMGSVLYF